MPRAALLWDQGESVDCPVCHGEGEISVQGYSHNPNCGIPTPDPQCERAYRCSECGGSGSIPTEETKHEHG